MSDDLRTRIAAIMLRIFDEDRTLTVDMGAFIVADAVTDLLIDMAGQGELLKAIDRMYR